MSCDVTLPWPSAKLSPNASSPGVWRIKQGAAKKYRADCLILAKAAKLRPNDTSGLSITFLPPDRRKRDLDGCLSRIKQGLDAIAEALGVDDSTFVRILLQWGEVVKGGAVHIRIGGVS